MFLRYVLLQLVILIRCCFASLVRFAFQYNPSLQPRALVVFGCISKRVTHGQIKQIIRILSKASPLLSIDRVSALPFIDYCTHWYQSLWLTSFSVVQKMCDYVMKFCSEVNGILKTIFFLLHTQ